ncbi:MAG TPA: hypothetical protein VFX53_06520 [Pedococcus sp.]|nr:hypothetical protein [Pedococcus sp.]
MTTFDDIRPIADAVLYEGYALYPYRANDQKNRVRWQFGVLVPERVSAADRSERSRVVAQLLVEGRAPAIEARVRFLQVQRRVVQRWADAGPEEVEVLEAGDTAYVPFDEALARETAVRSSLSGLARQPHRRTFTLPGGESVEAVAGGRLVRTSRELRAEVTLAAEPLEGPYGVTRLRVEVRNATAYEGPVPAPREDALRSALVAVHVVLRVEDGAFLSMTDPPEWASVLAQESPSDGLWPVLAGPSGSRDAALCSPIILPDHPEVAPESATAFFDGTEMDEMLSLRTLTLTEEEKRVVRGTDARTAALLDQVEGLPADVLDRLHGAVRYLSQTARRLDPGEAEESLEVAGVAVRKGSRVLLRPGRRRSDAQDIFLAGRTALVVRVMHDVDGGDHLAVVLEDDEGLDLAVAHGRYLYFAPDEVEPLQAAAP